MNIAARTVTLSLAALALVVASLPAEAGGRHGRGHPGHRWHGHPHHHHHRHAGVVWGIGLGIGAAALWHHQQAHAAAVWGPPPVYVAPPPVAYYEPAPALPRPPDPVIYPRMGQSPAQTEADRQDCNRWATTQPGAMAEASVFHRATMACMEGRGYTVR